MSIGFIFSRFSQRRSNLRFSTLSYSEPQILFASAHFHLLFPFFKLEETPFFAIYFRFQELCVNWYSQNPIFSNFSTELITCFPLFQKNDHWSRRKIVDSRNSGKLQISRSVDFFKFQKVFNALNLRSEGNFCWVRPVNLSCESMWEIPSFTLTS